MWMKCKKNLLFLRVEQGRRSQRLRCTGHASAEATAHRVGLPGGQVAVCKTVYGGSNRLNEVKELVR